MTERDIILQEACDALANFTDKDLQGIIHAQDVVHLLQELKHWKFLTLSILTIAFIQLLTIIYLAGPPW